MDFTKLDFGKEAVMLRCRSCKAIYHDICVDCTYRKGGKIVEDRERYEDTLSGFCKMMARDTMAETLQWMRSYNNPNLRR